MLVLVLVSFLRVLSLEEKKAMVYFPLILHPIDVPMDRPDPWHRYASEEYGDGQDEER